MQIGIRAMLSLALCLLLFQMRRPQLYVCVCFQGECQKQVMQHLQREGAALAAEAAARNPAMPGVALKIMSDIDDTVFSSGGSFPAGCDKRYPK
jgi:hypothetical protein